MVCIHFKFSFLLTNDKILFCSGFLLSLTCTNRIRNFYFLALRYKLGSKFLRKVSQGNSEGKHIVGEQMVQFLNSPNTLIFFILSLPQVHSFCYLVQKLKHHCNKDFANVYRY